jgi:hippurate hydrolase
MDALPVDEKTGLPYASRVHAPDDTGESVPVMHACGHDMHMTVFVGTARALAAAKGTWKGTLVFVGQPAEERAPGGAQSMLDDGLYTRFPKPTACLALHCDANRRTGEVGFLAGPALANVDTVDVVVRGVGGHGAYPQSTKDPVVLAAQIVLDLQTIVSREIAPGEPAVVTVGSIHGGTKHNIIPDQVKLELTVRSYTSATRDKVLAAIARIARGAAIAAGIPEDRMPLVDLHPDLLVPATWNDPALVERTVAALRTELGPASVVEAKPVMGGEDFGHFSLPDHSVPCFMFWLGTVDPNRVDQSLKTGVALPSLHSSAFAPVPERTLDTGVRAMTAAVKSALQRR